MSAVRVEPPAASAGASPGGTLVVGIGRPGAIEPSNAYEPMGAFVTGLVCDGLATFDPRTGEMKPALAESWQVSDDGTKLTVRLREGVRFHDSRELTADDIVFSLSRAASADFAGLAARLLQPIAGYAEVHGDVVVDDAAARRSLRGVRAVTKYTVEIQLTRPQADFVAILGHPVAAPISKAAATSAGEAFSARPVCAGPYRVAEPWDPMLPVIKLVKFARYYARNEAFTRGGAGYAEAIEVRVLDSDEDQLAAWAGGGIDVMVVPPTAVATARTRWPADLVQGPGGRMEYVGGPMSDTSPFGQQAVRRALSQSLDRQRLASEIYMGAAVPATDFLPPTLGGAYDGGRCGIAERADVEAARQTLASAGITAAGMRFRFLFNDDGFNRALVEAAAAQWRESLGLDLELVPVPWEEYASTAQGSPGLDGLFRVSWEAPYPSADAMLFPLFHSNGIGTANFGRFADTDVDRAIDRARKTDGDEDRALDYKKVEAALCEQLPLIPVVVASHHTLVAGRVASAVGEIVDRTSGMPLVREVYVKGDRP